MKEVYLVRHADWNLTKDQLTDEGKRHAQEKASALPKFKYVYSSPLNRAQETAGLLSGRQPKVDDRAATPKAPSEFGSQIMERRKTNPLGVAGVLFEIPEVRPALQEAGNPLAELVKQALSELGDDEAALIVSHDGTMVSAERVFKQVSFDKPLDHTYGELEGYVVDEKLTVRQL